MLSKWIVRYLPYGVILSVLVVGIAWVGFREDSNDTADLNDAATDTTVEQEVLSASVTEEPATLSIVAPELTFSFDGVVEPGDTVELFMRRLSETTDLDVSWSKYEGLGTLVASLQGLESKDGKYWLYYVNDTMAATGISEQAVQPGDTIEWRYE